MILTVMILGICVLAFLLVRNLRRTLYEYKNINYIAAVLFILISITAVLLKKGGSTEGPAGLITGLPRFFVSYALFAFFLLAVLLGISNISLIVHEGFRIKNLLGVILSGLYIAATYVVYILTGDSPFMRALSVFLTMMLCYFECVLAGTGIMGYLAARQRPGYDKDFIIIPGCSISRSGGLLPLLKGRTDAAIRYAWRQEIESGKPCRYVPSGGQGSDEIMSEGSAMELYLLAHGAEQYEVFPERESTSTYENMLFSKRIIDGVMPDARIAFATTNYHMLRCGLICHDLGIDAEGIAGGTKWYFWPNGFVREFVAILNMHRRGHIVMCIAGALISAIAVII